MSCRKASTDYECTEHGVGGTHPTPGPTKTSFRGLDCEYGGVGRSPVCKGLEESKLWLGKVRTGLRGGRGGEG